MKAKLTLILILAILPACKATIDVRPDGSCHVETGRTTAVSCAGSTIVTGKVLLSDETVQVLAGQAAEIIKDQE